jgi:penicillin-binding protein 1A
MKLSCDLYEINDELWTSIEKSVLARDSIMQADTLSPAPPETFLQVLYNRKKKIAMLTEQREQAAATSSERALN